MSQAFAYFQFNEAKKDIDVEEKIYSAIFPSQEEDFAFLKKTWSLYSVSYSFWSGAKTEDGRLFRKAIMARRSIPLDFKDRSFLRSLREELRAKAQEHTRYASDNSADKKASILERIASPSSPRNYELVVTDPFTFLTELENFYSSLRYIPIKENGEVLGEESIFVKCALGLVELTPATANLGAFPWWFRGEEKEWCTEFGWKASVLRDAILINYPTNNEEKDAIDSMSRVELFKLYREIYQSDAYLDWELLKKYQVFSTETMMTMAVETFGEYVDVVERMNYKDLVHHLEYLSDKLVSLQSKSQDIIENTLGKLRGDLYQGYEFVLREQRNSVWYPGWDGCLRLYYNNFPVISSYIPISYPHLEWACKDENKVSIGYIIFIAQQLQIWDIISSRNKVLTIEALCSEIDSILDNAQMDVEELIK